MATDLQRLRVSLTKHGAHKIAYLIQAFDKDDILNHIAGDYKDIHIDHAQVSNILSIAPDGSIPDLWNNIRNFGEQDIYDLVFISNIFSHIDLINTMIAAIDNNCVITRGEIINEKAYTNFAHTIDQLGFSIEHTPDFISFDISRIFYKFYLTNFIVNILELKLIDAGWDQSTTFIEECISNNFHKVFGLSPEEFEVWLNGALEIESISIGRVKAKRNFDNGIKFSPGHSAKFEGNIIVYQGDKHVSTFLHNKIQTRIYELLSIEFPDDDIGTEIPSNIGSIDLVRKHNGTYFFYEIKTASDTRSNIRQALSQLLEYAYWNDIRNVKELIIVAPTPSTTSSIKYINLLRNRFGIPIFYQHYNLDSNTLASKE